MSTNASSERPVRGLLVALPCLESFGTASEGLLLERDSFLSRDD